MHAVLMYQLFQPFQAPITCLNKKNNKCILRVNFFHKTPLSHFATLPRCSSFGIVAIRFRLLKLYGCIYVFGHLYPLRKFFGVRFKSI